MEAATQESLAVALWDAVSHLSFGHSHGEVLLALALVHISTATR